MNITSICSARVASWLRREDDRLWWPGDISQFSQESTSKVHWVENLIKLVLENLPCIFMLAIRCFPISSQLVH